MLWNAGCPKGERAEQVNLILAFCAHVKHNAFMERVEQPREIIEFKPNQPVQVALKYPTGKTVPGIRGERVMFSLTDNRVMFLDLGPAQRINELKVKPGEPFFVTLHWSGKKKDRKEWTASLAPEAELRGGPGAGAGAGGPRGGGEGGVGEQ